MACLGSRRHSRISCQPRHKRRVNGVYPASRKVDSPDADGLERLTYFIQKEPHKLDVVGEYLVKLTRKHVILRRMARIRVDLATLDSLMFSGQGIMSSVFVECFLESIQIILESPDTDLRTLSVNLFLKFTSIREEVPTCYKKYKYFSSRFSSMCLYVSPSMKDPQLKQIAQMRYEGLRGLQGLIRKSLSGDLRCNIWDYMNEIIPALLHNIQPNLPLCSRKQSKRIMNDRGNLSSVKADQCIAPESDQFETDLHRLNHLSADILNELCRKAHYEHTTVVVKPALRYIDSSDLWSTNKEQARVVVGCVVRAVQPQFKHIVIKHLVITLNENSSSDSMKRYGIALSVMDCLDTVVDHLPSQSYIQEILCSLLDQLDRSLTTTKTLKQGRTEDASEDMEKSLQNLLMKAVVKVTGISSDYQKFDVILALSDYIGASSHSEFMRMRLGGTEVRTLLLHRMLLVADQIKTLRLEESLPTKLFESLKVLTCPPSEEKLRVGALKIIQALVDKRGNRYKIESPVSYSDIKPNLTVTTGIQYECESCLDTYHLLLAMLCDLAKLSDNTIDTYRAVYLVMALASIEMMAVAEESLAGLIRASLTLQAISLTHSQLSADQIYLIHAVVAALMNLAPRLMTQRGGLELRNYVDKVISHRKSHDPRSLPESAFSATKPVVGVRSKETVEVKSALQHMSLFNIDIIRAALPKGFDMLDRPIDQTYRGARARSLSPDSQLQSTTSKSDGAFEPTPIDLEASAFRNKSVTFGTNRVDTISVPSLKNMILSSVDSNTRTSQREERQREVYQFFMTSSWSDILKKVNPLSDVRARRDELLVTLPIIESSASRTSFLSNLVSRSDANKNSEAAKYQQAFSLPASMIYDL